MDQNGQASEQPSAAADRVDRSAQSPAVAVMRPDGDRRVGVGEATPDWATVQALTFTANGLAG